MDRRAGACGASFLPSWPSFQGLSSAFRTDSLVLPICDPLTGVIDAKTRLASAKPRMVIKHRGAKSPKSTRKQAAQKQARAAATKQKGCAGCCRRNADIRIGRRSWRLIRIGVPAPNLVADLIEKSSFLAPALNVRAECFRTKSKKWQTG